MKEFTDMRTIIFIVIIMLTLQWSAFGQGYEAWLDSIRQPDYIASEYELEEVIVSDRDVKAKKMAFYRKDALTSTDDILENLEGIWMIKRGNYAAEPVMRGLSSGRINVTIDGMQMLGACTDKMDPVTSYIEPNNLDKIDITHGASGMDGGSTTGGTMDFGIKKPLYTGENIKGRISSRYSSAARSLEQLAAVNYTHNDVAINGGFTYRRGEDYRAGNRDIIPHSGFNKVNYNTSVSWRLQPDKLLNIAFIGDNAWDIGYPALPMDVGYARAKILGLQYDSWSNVLPFEHIQVKAYLNTVDHAMDDTEREVAMHMDMPGYTRTQGGYIKGELPEAHWLSGGLKVEAYHSFAHAEMTMYDPDSAPMFMLTWPDIDRMVTATTGHVDIAVNDRLKSGFNMRLERNHARMKSRMGDRQFSVFGYEADTKAKWLVNSGVSTTWQLTENWKTHLSLSYGERSPNESEQFGFYLYNSFDGYDYIGNPDIKKEKSTQVEIGSEFEVANVHWSVNLFGYRFYDYIYSRVDSSLSPMTIGANGVKLYENIPSAYLVGGENTIVYSSGRFSVVSVIKYAFGSRDGEKPLPLIPPLKSNLTINYTLPFGTQVLLSHEMATKQGRVDESFHETETDGYNIIDVGLRHAFEMADQTEVQVNLNVENLFDELYNEHLDWGNIPRPGRNISLGLTYHF